MEIQIQGEGDVVRHLTSTISENIGKGAQKTKIFSSASIYRVPKYLRKIKESTYTPRLVAIGPLHRNEHLQTPMEHVKMSYTDNLVCRLTVGMNGLELVEKKDAVLRGCVAEMKKSIDDAKKCYAEDVTLNEEMLLVDGCFILEFLYRSRSLAHKNSAEKKGTKSIDGGDNGSSKGQETDPIFGNSMTVCTVENDLVLLENQIPFFVLEKLFPLTVGQILDRHDKDWSLTDYVWGCYEKKLRPVGDSTNAKLLWVFGDKRRNSTRATNEGVRSAEFYHILHNLHDRFLPREQEKPGEVKHMPSASELYFAGVKFAPDATGNNLFKFKFSETKGLFWMCRRGRFVIPPLEIYDDTELYLRNLIAFEQCCPGVPQNVTSYAFVMDLLVNSDEDVQVLENAKVMRNYLGAKKDATNLFNELCKETAIGEFVFAEACIKATRYSKSFWPKHVIHLRRTYFASPWTFIAFCVGFTAFVISLVEFVRSFLKKKMADVSVREQRDGVNQSTGPGCAY